MEISKKFNKYIAIIAPIAFIILTLIVSLTKIPFYDWLPPSIPPRSSAFNNVGSTSR